MNEMKGELLKKLRPCPFCQSDHTDGWTLLDEVLGRYMLTHYCRAADTYTRVVTVYAATPEECIERWNADGKEQTSEIL